MPLLIRFMPYILILALITALVVTIYLYGYNDAINDTKEKAIKEEAELRANVEAVQSELYDTERAWLNDEAETKVEVREKVKVVTKEVKKYVKDNNLASCSLDPKRVQLVNEAIKSSNK